MINKRIFPFQLSENIEKASYQTTADVGKPISSMGVVDKRPSAVRHKELSDEEKQKMIKRHEERMSRRLHSTGMHRAASRFERSFDDSDLVKGMENRRVMPEAIAKDKFEKGRFKDKVTDEMSRIDLGYDKMTDEDLYAQAMKNIRSKTEAKVDRDHDEGRKKSLSTRIDELLEKAISSLYTTPGALSSKRSGGYEGVKVMKELDKRIKGKKEPKVEVTKQYPPTSPVRDKEAYGMGGAEKSYSLDFNKSILERMGLEKGRKAAWQKELKDEEDKEAMMPGRLVGDPGSRIHERKRVGEIGESGRAENLRRMSASKDPADVKYAKKYGY